MFLLYFTIDRFLRSSTIRVSRSIEIWVENASTDLKVDDGDAGRRRERRPR